MNFIVKLIRYTKSKLVPLYARLIFYFYKRLSRDYAHEKFLLLKANFKIKKFYLDFFINKFRDYPYFYWERYKVAIQLGEKNCISYLNNYSQKRKEWVKKNLSKFLNIEFVEEKVTAGSFGNIYYLYSLLLANELKLRDKKKIFLYSKNKATNEALFEYFKDYLVVTSDLKKISSENLIVEKLNCHLGSAMEIEGNFLQPSIAQNIIIKKNEEKKIKLFHLKKEHYIKGENYLNKMGLKKNNWYVTLHVRDKNYRLFEKNENFRNADINDYIPAINEIVNAGGFVFRVGHVGSKQLPKIKGLIDYANSEDKSEILDIFLGATSKFCIATSSGYYIIPSFFSVPILMTNCPQHSVFFELTSNDIYLPRIFKSSTDNKMIKIAKIFQPPYNNLFSDKLFEQFNLDVVKNTQNEIRLATKEIIDRLFNDKKKQSDLQFKINKKIEHEQLRIGNNLTAVCNISDSFLEKNLDLI